MKDTPQNDDVQQDFEDVAGQEDGIPDDAEIAETPIRITPELLQRDRRSTGIVEVNLSTGEAVVVEVSDKPKLTKKALKEYGAPIQVGTTYYEGAKRKIEFYHGVPLAVQIEKEQLLNTYKGQDMNNLVTFTQREKEAKMLVIARQIPNGFSYQGTPAELPAIEDCSDILLGALWEAYADLHFPTEPNWYQVHVKRTVPAETLALLGKTFESYPVGGEKIEINEMPEDEIQTFTEQSDAQRAVLVSSMITSPELLLNGEGAGKHPYPIESLSEQMMAHLHRAYRALNVPAGGLDFLSTFRRSRLQRNRKERDRRDTSNQ